MLLEATTTVSAALATFALDLVQRATQLEGCVAAVCMADGHFGGLSSLFSPSLAEVTYALSFGAESGVVAASPRIRASAAWRAIVSDCNDLLEALLVEQC